jgi:hypothetical protein
MQVLSGANKTRLLKLLFLTIAVSVIHIEELTAQPFKVDEYGHVNDLKFKKVIKEKGYSLVSTFDTILRRPKVFLAATAIKNGEEIRINTSGAPFDVKVLQPYYPQVPSHGSANSDIPIAAPDESNEQYEVVWENQKCGTRTKTTHKQGLPAIYETMTWTNQDHLVFMKIYGKYGVAKTDGTILLKPTYTGIDMFSGGDAGGRVYIFHNGNGKTGLLNASFKEVLPPVYDYINGCFSCTRSSQILIVGQNRKQGLADKHGKVIFPPAYDRIEGYSGNALIVSNANLYGLVDTTGKILLPLECNKIKRAITGNYLELTKNNLHGMADINGKVLVEPKYFSVSPLMNGMAIVAERSGYGVVNANANLTIPTTYTHLELMGKYFLVQKAGKVGLVDVNNHSITTITYDKLQPANKEFFFKQGDQTGLVDTKGQVIRKFAFADVSFSEGYLIIKKNEKYGIADLQGNFVVEPKYDEFANSGLSSGLIWAKLNGRRCRIDLYGNEVFKQ